MSFVERERRKMAKEKTTKPKKQSNSIISKRLKNAKTLYKESKESMDASISPMKSYIQGLTSPTNEEIAKNSEKSIQSYQNNLVSKFNSNQDVLKQNYVDLFSFLGKENLFKLSTFSKFIKNVKKQNIDIYLPIDFNSVSEGITGIFVKEQYIAFPKNKILYLHIKNAKEKGSKDEIKYSFLISNFPFYHEVNRNLFTKFDFETKEMLCAVLCSKEDAEIYRNDMSILAKTLKRGDKKLINGKQKIDLNYDEIYQDLSRQAYGVAYAKAHMIFSNKDYIDENSLEDEFISFLHNLVDNWNLLNTNFLTKYPISIALKRKVPLNNSFDEHMNVYLSFYRECGENKFFVRLETAHALLKLNSYDSIDFDLFKSLSTPTKGTQKLLYVTKVENESNRKLEDNANKLGGYGICFDSQIKANIIDLWDKKCKSSPIFSCVMLSQNEIPFVIHQITGEKERIEWEAKINGNKTKYPKRSAIQEGDFITSYVDILEGSKKYLWIKKESHKNSYDENFQKLGELITNSHNNLTCCNIISLPTYEQIDKDIFNYVNNFRNEIPHFGSASNNTMVLVAPLDFESSLLYPIRVITKKEEDGSISNSILVASNQGNPITKDDMQHYTNLDNQTNWTINNESNKEAKCKIFGLLNNTIHNIYSPLDEIIFNDEFLNTPNRISIFNGDDLFSREKALLTTKKIDEIFNEISVDNEMKKEEKIEEFEYCLHDALEHSITKCIAFSIKSFANMEEDIYTFTLSPKGDLSVVSETRSFSPSLTKKEKKSKTSPNIIEIEYKRILSKPQTKTIAYDTIKYLFGVINILACQNIDIVNRDIHHIEECVENLIDQVSNGGKRGDYVQISKLATQIDSCLDVLNRQKIKSCKSLTK